MSYHGGVRDTVKSIYDKEEDKEDLRRARMRWAFKKFKHKMSLTFEEKMKNPAYAAAVELNQRHGIGPPRGSVANGRFVGRGFKLPSGEKMRQGYLKVSPPVITAMEADREEGKATMQDKARERAAAEERLVSMVRDFVQAAQFNLQHLQEIKSTYLNQRQPIINVLQLHRALHLLIYKTGIKFTPEEMDFSRKRTLETGELERRAANPASQYKNRYKKKRFVSLPKIDMPMGDEE